MSTPVIALCAQTPERRLNGRFTRHWPFADVIDNQSHLAQVDSMNFSLDQLPFRTPAIVAGIDWARLATSDAKRLRNLGFDEGVEIEALHAAPFGKDPLAVRIGRMMVAVRRAQAQAISVHVEEVGLAAE